MASKLGDKTENMSPKDNYDPTDIPNTIVDEDLQEMEAVMESLDELGNIMDSVEQRADNIIEQLKLLLHSNQEMRQELAMQRTMATTAKDSKDSSE